MPAPAKPIFNRNSNQPATGQPTSPNGAGDKPQPVKPALLSRDEQAARSLLSQAMRHGAVVMLSLRSGKFIHGTIQRFDSFTIALRDASDQRLVLYFKHAIDSIEFPEGFPPEVTPQG